MNDVHPQPAPQPNAATSRRRRRRRGRLSTLGVVAVLTLAAGCVSQDEEPGGTAQVTEVSTDEFHGTLVDPPLAPAAVTLRDTDGNRVRLDQLARSDRRPGTATAVFFGFTNCHDVCPTTMADLAAARRTLPAATADDVDLVFITVDPQRDTAPVLRRWLDQFDPDIVGLRGPVARVHRAEDSLYASQSSKTTPPPEETEDDTDSGAHEHHESGESGESGKSGESGGMEEGHIHPDGDPGGYAMDHTSVVYVFGPDDTTLLYTGGATPPDYADDLSRLLGR